MTITKRVFELMEGKETEQDIRIEARDWCGHITATTGATETQVENIALHFYNKGREDLKKALQTTNKEFISKLELEKEIDKELKTIEDVPLYINNYKFPEIVREIRIKLKQLIKGK